VVYTGPIRYRPFQLTVPHSPIHHPSPTPATSNRTGGFSRIRLAAKTSSIEVMNPFARMAAVLTPDTHERRPPVRSPTEELATVAAKVWCASVRHTY
jgi:hypothetical protein